MKLMKYMMSLMMLFLVMGYNAMDVRLFELNKQLYNAALHGELETAQHAIKNGADVNDQDKDGRTALMCAAQWGNIEICKLLINEGAFINIVDIHGHTALWGAISQSEKEICQLLIDNGADLNLVDKNGDTALLFAARMGHPVIIRMLLTTIPTTDQVKILKMRESIWASLSALKRSQPRLPKDIRMLVAQGFISKPQIDQLMREQMDRVEKMLRVRNKRGHSPYDEAIDRRRFENAQALNLNDPATREALRNQIKAHIIHL